jgi:hypothetical protein
MKTITTCLTLLCVIGLTASAASAATISWGKPKDISSSTDVSTNGKFVEAWNFGGITTTVNGVTFTAGSASGGSCSIATDLKPDGKSPAWNCLDKSTLGHGSVSDKDYQALIRSACWSGTPSQVGEATKTFRLSGLAVGKTYEIQIWVNDSRGTSRIIKASGSPKDSVTLAYCATGQSGFAGQYVTGTFIADKPDQAITLTPGQATDINFLINALQVRIVPEKTAE